MKKNCLVLVDFEGIIGVSRLYKSQENTDNALREIETVINVLHREGYFNISVCNIHNDGKGLPEYKIERMGAKLIKGLNELSAVVANLSFAIMIGFHGMRNSGGFFDHSFRMDIVEVKYGDKSIGEVGIFYRWLLGKGVPTLLVSGEGNFALEIDEFDCEVHTLLRPPITQELIESDYCMLRSHLKKALARVNLPVTLPKCEDVTVYLDNTDKYEILNDYSYFDEEMKCFRFPSVNAFISEIYTFSGLLNSAANEVYRRNLLFLENIKPLLGKEQWRMLLENYGEKQISEINCDDRKRILNMIEDKLGTTVVLTCQ